uniref:Secreted protein n=1 Tax=Amblyomma cajennense TaxID=34607 RepID=A0A023FFY3_AMBCJ
MRALVACLALFLALAVLHCDAKRKKRDAGKTEGRCIYDGIEVGDGRTKRMEKPCVKVTCSGGAMNVTTCDLRKQERKRRSEEGKKHKADKEDGDETENKKKNVFPHCCKTED